jgi:precorrin-6B methylase 2
MSDWSPEGIAELARRFMECRIFLTGAELGLFDLLASEELTTRELVDRTGANDRGLAIVLDALVAMGLLVKQGGRYHCEPSAARLLATDGAAPMLPMVLHSADLWKRWSNLTEAVGGARPETEEARLHHFIGSMNVIAQAMAERIVACVAPSDARRLLDVGGASGTYTLAFLRAAPRMSATLFDLPEVMELARERLAAAGMLERVALVPGNFHDDPLPPGHDLAFVSAIIHANGPAQNEELFRKVYAALVPGGRIVVRDIVLSSDRTRPRAGAVMAVNWLLVSEAGNSYTFEEIKDGLERAGFTRVRLVHPDTRMDGLVEGFRPVVGG